MRIMTWNINRFDGLWDWYNSGKDIPKDKREDIVAKVIDALNSEIKTASDIAILQEVPYCPMPYDKNAFEIDFWKQIFEKKKLKIHLPNITIAPVNVTIAVTAIETDWQFRDKKIVKFDDSGKAYSNAYIEACMDRVSLLGIHSKNGAAEINYALDEVDEASRPDIIIGDFNAGDWGRTHYDKGINREEYIKLKQRFGYTDVCGGRVTNHVFNSPIDHFLITNMIGYTYDITRICIDDSYSLSDHYPIIVEMNERNLLVK